MPDSQLLTPEQRLVSAKRDLGLPIVVICGSTRFMGEMAEADFRETVAGRFRQVRRFLEQVCVEPTAPQLS
ncbi:hypothetical protein ACF064_35950 [Streptomyces sp. NPDC015492]|uniref:hypothetical protein n=1 Tax=unclassified Streptomyces TaxID=2593676 RepID=UPI0036FF1073